MPRQSKASRTVIPINANAKRPALKPIHRLPSDTLRIFKLVATRHAHLREIDVPLLEAYAVAAARMHTCKKPGDLDRLARCTMALARSLRLAPITMDAKTVARAYANQVKNKYTWPVVDDDDDDSPAEVAAAEQDDDGDDAA